MYIVTGSIEVVGVGGEKSSQTTIRKVTKVHAASTSQQRYSLVGKTDGIEREVPTIVVAMMTVGVVPLPPPTVVVATFDAGAAV